MNSAAQQPSRSWEIIRLPESPEHGFWVWHKPALLPDGLMVRVPQPPSELAPPGGSLSLRRLLELAGVDAAGVVSWVFCGAMYPARNGTAPELDLPLPHPPPGTDPNIYVRLASQAVPLPPAPATPVSAGAPPGTPPSSATAVFERMEIDWQAAVQIEKQTVLMRKQLADMLNRLNGLNRDLSPDERLHGDRKDKSDWQIARRWLRDLSTRVSKCIKDQDIGDTSMAGRRNRFEEIYETFVSPRRPFDGMEQWQREFETYRKMVQTQQLGMTSVYTAARQDGERRAQQILKRIADSVRAARGRRK